MTVSTFVEKTQNDYIVASGLWSASAVNVSS